MVKGPISVIIIGCLYILAGVTGVIYHVTESMHFDVERLLILIIGILAIIGGIFALRGKNWARWLLIVWIAGHVILSFWHSLQETVMHSLIAGLTVYCLFNKKALNYYQLRGKTTENMKKRPNYSIDSNKLPNQT